MVEAGRGAPEAAFGRAVPAILALLDEACCVVSVDKCVMVDGTAAGRRAKRGQRWGPMGSQDEGRHPCARPGRPP
eukprot:13558420-Alexandrium_andersonii.AAC.1